MTPPPCARCADLQALVADYRNTIAHERERAADLQAENERLKGAFEQSIHATKFAREGREQAEADLTALRAERDALREALRLADEAIVRGQECRSEAEFTRWMHESQAMRPVAALAHHREGEQG